MRDEDLRVFLEQRGDLDHRHVLGDGIKTLQRVGAEEEIDLADRQQDLIVRARAARHDGDVEAVFPVGAVGQRLVEAAVLALRHPIGAERDLVERLREGRCRRGAGPNGEPGQHRPAGLYQSHRLLLFIGDATIEHAAGKWDPDDAAQTQLDGHDLAGRRRRGRRHRALDRRAAARRGRAARAASAARRRYLHRRSLSGAGRKNPARRPAGVVPAGAADRRLRRAFVLSRAR